MALRIYLAGFDVFYSDAAARADAMKKLCTARGLEGVFPSDITIDRTGLTDAELARAIFDKDIKLIDQCDIIAANLNAFRGAEPDSGTSFEMGYGHAKGKLLYAYTDGPATMAERVEKHHGLTSVDASGHPVDELGFSLENFGSPLNLMLSVPATVVLGSFEDCVNRIASDLSAAGQ